MNHLKLSAFFAFPLLMVGCTGELVGPHTGQDNEGEIKSEYHMQAEKRGGLATLPRKGNGRFAYRDGWQGSSKPKDAGAPKPDKKAPKPDKSVPKADLPAPKPDKSAPKPDKSAPKPDKSAPKPDQFVPKPDKSAPKPDQFMPKPDQFMPKPDQFMPKPDTLAPSPDSGGTAPPSAGTVYYVRPKGGTASQCTGKVNANYPGSGTGKPCAFSHPFIAMPPDGKPLIKGGDTLFIASGDYRMGHGAPGAGACDKAFPWDCFMPAVPSGASKTAPTRILGEGWDSGCKAAPRLHGVERAYRVLDLRGSSYVHVSCLEITDNSGCVDSHSGKLACKRSSYPFGGWAAIGIEASDSKEVILRDLDIHGMAHTGVLAGRLTNWTLERVRIAANGWVGWDGDLQEKKGSANLGTTTFRKVTIEYNGCAETYPGRKPNGCWGQSAGGYGDGLGTAATAGDWLFEDSAFLHNTSDGLDLLYHELGGKVTVRRVRAEGNAGNQLKIAGNAHIENSILVGNCAYFKGKSFTYNVDHCRALGNTLELAYQAGTTATLINNTIYGQGDVLVDAMVRFSKCNGSEKLISYNNLFLGDTDYHQPFEKTAKFYQYGCSGLKMTGDYNLVWNTKNGCSKEGSHDLCANPKLGPLSGDKFGMMPAAGSPAIDSGKDPGGLIPAIDFLKVKRPLGKGTERGACEVKP